MDRSLFRHTMQLRVRNYEIDWQGIVHNAVYLHYFEVGRVAYLESLGIQIDVNTIQHESRVVVVRNELDYRSPAHFGETLDVHTRVSSIGDTSFTFEGMIEESATGRLVAENRSVHVWLEESGHRPVRVPEAFREIVRSFEGKHCEFRPISKDDPHVGNGSQSGKTV